MTYFPSTLTDHVNLELSINLKIGVEDCDANEEIVEFLKQLKVRIEQTGAQIVKSESHITFKNAFVGSQREKIRFDSDFDRYGKGDA